MSSGEDKTPVIRVAGVCGSLRPGSATRMALQVALRGAESAGAETRLLDLAEYHLPFCSGKDQEAHYPENVRRFRADLRWGDGILLATPEYHGSFSGVLKNALDLAGFDEFEGKLVGLVGVSGGRLGASDALNSLRTVGRALHAWVVPTQAAVADARNAFAPNGEPKDPQTAERLLDVGKEVAHFARLHRCGEHFQFLQDWQTAPENPGGGKVAPRATVR